MSDERAREPDYGLDAPGVIRNLALAGAGCGAVALGLRFGNHQSWRSVSVFLAAGVMFFGEVAWMIWSSRTGKLRARDRLLDAMKLQPDARVLDVGCGHGLLLIGAAKRAPRGQAVGIDLWSQTDQARNGREHTLRNAELEGVADRVAVDTGDMRALPFPDGHFDAAVACLSIHNIPDASGRAQAVRELARVLKPGGQIALLDFKSTAEYAAAARDAGLHGVSRSGLWLSIFPPVRAVTGTKP